MTKFTITLTDPGQLAGVAAARAQYNADNAETEGFVPVDDAGYWQFIGESVAASWAAQHGTAKVYTDDPTLVGKTLTDESGKPVEVAFVEEVA